MKATRAWQPSFRSRLLLYLAGLAAVALSWGYLLFIRPRRWPPSVGGEHDGEKHP